MWLLQVSSKENWALLVLIVGDALPVAAVSMCFHRGHQRLVCGHLFQMLLWWTSSTASWGTQTLWWWSTASELWMRSWRRKGGSLSTSPSHITSSTGWCRVGTSGIQSVKCDGFLLFLLYAFIWVLLVFMLLYFLVLTHQNHTSFLLHINLGDTLKLFNQRLVI